MNESILLNYFLVILTSSFLIFSLSIKSQSFEKVNQFAHYLSRLKTDFSCIINGGKRKSKKSIEKIRNLEDYLETEKNQFRFCLFKVNCYVYHSFYIIFFLSGTGLILSMLGSIFKWTNWSIYLIIVAISIILWYYVMRAIFVLLCYTKITDIDYLERLSKKLENMYEYNLNSLNEINYSSLTKNFVFKCFFFIFFIFNKSFKTFFDKYYGIEEDAHLKSN